VADTKSAVAYDSNVGVVERVQLDQRVRNVMLARDFRGAPAVEIGVALRVAVVGINGVVRCVSGCRVRCLWRAAPGDRCSGLTDDAVGQGASRSFGGRDQADVVLSVSRAACNPILDMPAILSMSNRLISTTNV